MARLEGKVALVAGAGGGIGGAGAAGLASEGASVVSADIDAAAAEAVAARIRAGGGRATSTALDVRDREAVDAVVAITVRAFGRLDVLLDCAGVSHGGTFLDLEHGEWERVIAVNLTGMFHLGQAAARQMVRQGGGGSIINVTSQLAEVARPERAAYVASKGGGRSLTHAMALDLPTPSGGVRRSRKSRLAALATHRISSARSCFSPRTSPSGRPAARSPSTAAITRCRAGVPQPACEGETAGPNIPQYGGYP